MVKNLDTRYARTSKGELLIDADRTSFVDPVQGPLGNIQPKWIGGLTNSLSYGPFISVFFDMRKGGVIENNVDGYGYFYGTPKVTENRGPMVVQGISDTDDKT